MKTRSMFLALALTFAPCLAPAAHAEQSAVVKAGTGIENRQPVGVGASFKAGEPIFVWSEVRDADGKTAEHVWKRDGKEVNHARLPVRSRVWRTSSRVPRAAAGSWTVEVIVDGQTLGTVSFKVE